MSPLAIINTPSIMWRISFRLLVCCCLLSVSSIVYSQADIRDASAASNTDNTNSNSSATEPSASERAATLVFQVQALQEEVAALRGLIEEQQHEIKRLKQQRLEDYLDLDKRLTDLTAKEPSLTSDGNVSPGTSDAVDGAIEALGSTEEKQADDGDELYSQAIDQLLNQQDYKGAQQAFSNYIEQYPQGALVPNAYYWQGQILSTEGNSEQAEELFKKLIADYPDHSKAPDAKFKLAKIYFDQGKKNEAKTLLEDVVASGSDAAVLAESFLSKNY